MAPPVAELERTPHDSFRHGSQQLVGELRDGQILSHLFDLGRELDPERPEVVEGRTPHGVVEHHGGTADADSPCHRDSATDQGEVHLSPWLDAGVRVRLSSALLENQDLLAPQSQLAGKRPSGCSGADNDGVVAGSLRHGRNVAGRGGAVTTLFTNRVPICCFCF